MAFLLFASRSLSGGDRSRSNDLFYEVLHEVVLDVALVLIMLQGVAIFQSGLLL
jgi:hypothetical protein